MFTAALFKTTKMWTQSKCPLTEEWIKKMWYIYTILLSHKKNKIMPFATTFVDLAGIKIAGRNINHLRYADDTTLMAESEEEIIQSEVSQKEKHPYSILTHIYGI